MAETRDQCGAAAPASRIGPKKGTHSQGLGPTRAVGPHRTPTRHRGILAGKDVSSVHARYVGFER